MLKHLEYYQYHKDTLIQYGLKNVEIFPDKIYFALLQFLNKMEYSFEEIFEKKICEDDDKPTGKILLNLASESYFYSIYCETYFLSL